jgi:hypothetical protein
MSKKKLDVSSITNELRGQSVFFPGKTQAPVQPQKAVSPTPPSHIDQHQQRQQGTHDTVIPRYHDTVIDTTIPSYHDTMIPETEEEMLEAVRKGVKQIGKEPATQRLTTVALV